MAITGNDLLKKRKGTTNEDKEGKKVITGDDLLKTYKTNTKEVDQKYIDTFINDANTFFTSAEKDYEGLGWANASSSYDSRNSTWQDLNTRADTIEAWLFKNRSKLGGESYDSLNSYLNDFRGGGSSVLDTFKRASDYYSKWKTEEDYNKEVSERKGLMSFDLEAGKAEIEDLEAQLAEANNAYGKLNNQITAYGRSHNTKKVAELREQQKQLEKTINSLKSTLSQKNQYHTLAGRAQKAEELKSVADPTSENYDKDFDKYAQIGAEVENPTLEEEAGWLAVGSWNPFGEDPKNKVTYARDNYQEYLKKSMQASMNGGVHPEAYQINDLYWEMTDDEVALHNYYLAKDMENGTNYADEYLDTLADTLEYRKAEKLFKPIEDNLFAEYVFGVAAGLDQFASGMEALFSDEDYIPTSAVQYASGMVREDLADNGAKLPDWLGGSSLGQVGYDIINTTSNMLPSILASTAVNVVAPGSGAVVGATLMGASAGGSAKAEMLRLGYSKEQASTYGIMVGIAEGAMEYLIGGISKLGGKLPEGVTGKILTKVDNAFARTAIKIGGSMLSEGLEEGLQTVIEPWLKEIATNVDWEDPNIDEVLYSSLLGALSAFVLEGGTTVAGEVGTYKSGKTIQKVEGGVEKLQSLGSTFSADTVAYKIASKVNENTDAYTIGRLLNEVGATLSEQNVSDIIEGLTSKGIRKADATKIARGYQAYLNSEMNLSDEAVKTLEGLSPLADVLRTNIIGSNTTVYQRTRGYSDLMALADEVANPKKEAKSERTPKESTEPSMNVFDQQMLVSDVQNIADDISKGTNSPIRSAMENKMAQTHDAATRNVVNTLGVRGVYSSSETGSTRLKSNRQRVEIVGVASLDKEGLKLKLKDGSVVDAKDINFSTSEEALVYEAVANMGMSANTAWEIIKGFDPKSNQKGAVYAMGALEAYTYGHNGVKVEGMSKNGFSSLLSATQKNTANKYGDIDARAKVDAKQSKIDTEYKKVRNDAKSKGKAIPKRKGDTILEFSEDTTLTELQQKQLEVLESVAKGMGVTFHIFASSVDANGKRYYKMPNGKYTGANGWYDPKTGEIWIDLYAGNDGQGTMIFTAAHELTHFIAQWSPAKFKIFADFLFEQYGKKGQDVNELIRNQMQKAKANGRTISWDEAYEEVVADSTETFLRDSKAAEKIAALREKDTGLANKIKSFLGQMLAKMRNLMSELGLAPETNEGKMVAEMTDSLQKLYDLWTDALADAGRKYSTLAEIDFDTESVAPMLSERTWTASEYVTEREETAKQISKALGVDIKTAYKYIDDINGIARLIADDRARLDYEPNLDENATVLKPNSEYKYSVDMSTLCAKRLLFTGTFDAIQKALPDMVFDSEDIVSLREMMLKRGYEVACGICYVESTRREIGRITQEFIDRYKIAQKTGMPISRINSSGKEVVLKSAGRTFSADKNYTPNLGELNTTDIDIVKKDHREVYDAYLAFMNARGQAKPKLLETRAEYKGEILKHFKAKSAVEARNNAGGLRLQSFSDFEVPHMIDMMQIVMDMARVGLKSQAYTKVPAFAEVFGDSGVKINLSLIAKGDGLDSKGNLIFDDVEGINHTEAFKLRDKYSKNVGTILVGKTDAHIIAAMADPRIDYIIPFHKSSWKESLYDALGLTGYADYTDYQNEKAIDKDRKIKNFDPSEYWDFTKSGDENAQIYLEKCREDGRIPKFPQFQGYPGYWKLLIDFKMYDNNGVGSPQEVVRPTFNTEASERILSEYKGGHRSFPVAKDVVEDFVKGHKENLKYSDRDSDSDFHYSFRGINKDGIEVYETSDEIKNLTYKERKKAFKTIMANQYKGRTAKFTRNGHTYYAMFDDEDIDKNIYGDNYSSKKGWKAKINVGADGNIFELVENALYNGSEAERGKKIASHRSAGYWDYFIKTVQIDGVVFDLIANVRKKPNDSFVYSIQLNENKKIEASPSLGTPNGDLNRMLNASDDKISQKPNFVNSNTEKNSLRNVESIETADYVKMYNHFGSTKNYDVAGYMLGNGVMLDFSGKHWGDDYSTSRQVDHRDIQEVLSNRGSNNGVNAMIDMIGNGNIRLMPEVGGINLAVKPNASQLSQLRGYINHFRGEVTIDIDEVGGDTIHSFNYTRGTSSSKILDDIKAYFDEGIVPEQKAEDETDIRQFLYSDRDSDYVEDGNKAVMTQKRIDYLIEDSGAGTRKDYAQAWIARISPTDYLNLTTSERVQDREVFDQFGSEWNPNVNMTNYDYLGQLQKSVRQTPYLAINIDTGEVVGHDGRHRIRALEMNGIKSVEIKIEFRDADGSLVKYQPKGERWESIKGMTLTNQFGTKQTASAYDLIPLNEDHRSEIEAIYGENSDPKASVKYSDRVIPTGIELPEGTKVDKSGKPLATQAQRDAGYMLSESKFYQMYSAHKLTYSNRGGEIHSVIEKIKQNGFISSTSNANVLPTSTMRYFHYDRDGKVKFDNIVQARYAPKKGDYVLFVPNNYVTKDDIIKNGFKPLDYEIGVVEYDYQPYYEVYKKAYDKAYEQTHDGNVLYSDRNPSSVSNRTLLANALESVAQNDIERNKLSQYKEKIALIEAEQEKLAELRGKIKELSFAKGARDTKAIKDLQFEANQTANRINTYDRQLLNLESTTALKGVLEREKQKAYKRAEEKGKEALDAYREKMTKTQRELITRYQDSRKKGIESRNKTEMRHKIQKVVGDLKSLLLDPTKERHVPIGLQKPVAEALDIINMDTVGADERVAKYNELIHKSNDPDVIAELTKSRDRIALQGENLSDKLTSLKLAYADIKNSDDPLVRDSHNEAIEDLITNTAEMVGSTSIRDMSYEQLEAVYDMYKAILATVRNANKMFKADIQETITENSEAVKSEVREAGGHRDRVLKATKWLKKFGWNMLKPIYAMKMIGSNTLTKLYENVRKGEDTWARDVNEAKEFFRETSKKYNYDSWDFKKQYSFKDSTGKSFSLSLEQIMSLYAYSKRNQADKHLEIGGFIFDDSIEVIERKGKFGIPLKYEVNDANPYRLKKSDLGEIISILDTDLKEVKGFVDEMQAYLSDVMGAKGNEVSLAMYDIKLYKEKNYFPLKTAKYFREFDPEKNGTPKIKNSGFSKKTVPQAGNPIILSNFMDVWANHVNDMSMYHAFVLPLEDFMRVYNYSSTAGGYDSVQQYIKNAYGSQANSYIETLMNDLNGGARTDPSADVISKGLSLFKKAKVFASLSVVVQQPSAIARAMAYIDAKYFVDKPSATKHSKTWAEVKKYAPVAIIKEMGYFDTNMGRSTVDFITSREYNGIKEKMGAMFTDSDYRDEVLSKAPALADELAWCAIWKAVKRETLHTHPKLQPNSEAFLKAVGERFTEVITKTQVYDSVLSRSAMMRSKDTGMKMATAFMAEPTTSLNMAVDAIIEGKRGNKAFTRKALGSIAASVILNSILVSIVYAMRDDDEDETYTEKYLESLTTELIDGFNPLTYVPFIKDLWSIAQGFDIERSDMSLAADLWASIENLFSENKSGFEKVEGVVGNISSVFGLPVANIMRDARGMYNLAKSLTSGIPTTKSGVGDAVVGAVKNSIPLVGRFAKDESKGEKLYDAIVKGDTAYVERLKSGYDDEDSAIAAIRKHIGETYKSGEMSYTEAMNALINHGGYDRNKAYWKLREWDFDIENGEDAEYSKYGDFYEAVRTGKNIKSVIKEYTDNGVSTETLASQITSYYKPLYKEMSNSERASIKGYLLNAYALLGYDRNKKSKDIDKWLED